MTTAIRRDRLTVIDLDKPHGVTRSRLLGKAAEVKAQLAASLNTEAGKRRVNADRAGSRARAGQ